MVIVLVLAGWFGFLAADRWLAMPRSWFAERDEHVVVLCTVSATAALTVYITLA